MKIIIPKYLLESGSQKHLVTYDWDAWHHDRTLRVGDPGLIKRLSGISQRAVLGFACGSAEWIIYRLESLCATSAPWTFMESAWAMLVHLRYGAGAESWSYFCQEGWDDPIKAPIHDALEQLEAAIYLLHSESRTDPSVIAGKIAKLAAYVMPDSGPYQAWTDRVLDRLERLYPRIPQDPLGDVIPRTAMDPDVPFDPKQTEYLINQFLTQLKQGKNPFLRAPQKMAEVIEGEEEFRGTPYVFEIAMDLAQRRRS